MPASLEDSSLDRSRLPQHVAIIMDGNGRWAKSRGFPRLLGHREGAKSVREIVQISGELGIKFLTLYAFSTENWNRPRIEINGLMRLLKATLRKEQESLNRNGVRLETIGDISVLPSDVRDQLEKSRVSLSKNRGLCLNLALNYGGRQDIVQACNRLIAQGQPAIDEHLLQNELFTKAIPDPDLVIRTSGEFRVSNFLLWQIAYSEFYFTPVLWPDFRRAHFIEALKSFQNRDRRFGSVSPLL